MKLQNITLLFIIAFFSLGLKAETKNNKVSLAHRKAHSEQLANIGNRMDKNVISDFIQNDVKNRETKYADLSNESAMMLDDVIKEARKHMGKPYKHGAAGPKIFDCSGFSSFVYKQFGFSISRSSKEQYTQGIPVNRKDLRTGDLVFFTSRSSRGQVGHVGIVVSANNETGEFSFIHASVKGVRINDCVGYYENRYIGARRIIIE